MAIRQGTAYALRTRPLGEADLIVEFFTLEHGRVRVVARSARRLRSRFGSAFEPFTRSRLVWFQRDKDDLGRVSSTEIDRSWFETLSGLEQSLIAAYMAELLMAFMPERDPAPRVFRLVGAILDTLESGADPDLLARYFEVWLLRLSGLFPDVARCGECGKTLADAPWVSDVRLELLCGRTCGAVVGRRRLAPAARLLLDRVIRLSPDQLAAENPDSSVVVALGEVSGMLVCGHLDRTPRSLRVIRRLEGHMPGSLQREGARVSSRHG